MALYTNPPHSVTLYTVNSSRDAGGGTLLTYTLAQSGVACSINTASATEIEQYAQKNIRVSHTVAFLSSTLSSTPTRGMKVVADDTSGVFYVRGIRSGRAYGGIPAFTYLDVEESL